MGDPERVIDDAAGSQRVSLRHTILEGATHPPMRITPKRPGLRAWLDLRGTADLVPDPQREPKYYDSFLEWAYNTPCEELWAVHPNKCKLFPLLQKHFRVCLGRHCPGYGRENSSGIGRGGSREEPPDLEPVYIESATTNKRVN